MDEQQGLLQRGAPQSEQMAPRPGQEMPDEMPDGEPASPEEQAQYEKMINNAMKTIHGKQSDQLLERLAQGEPEEAIADVAVGLVIKLYESAEQSGSPLSEAVLMTGGEEIINEIINLGIVAGIYDFDEAEGEEIQQEAWFIALDKFGRFINQTGKIDSQGLEQGAQEVMAGKYDHISTEVI